MKPDDILALFTDDDAVSPVIGVILMVAITVVLAAVIGAFVIGVGGETRKTPSAAMDFDYDSSTATVEVTHGGGDTLQVSNVRVRESKTATQLTKNSGPTEYTAGDDVAYGTYDPGETIEVIWDGSDAGKSAIIAQSRAPN